MTRNAYITNSTVSKQLPQFLSNTTLLKQETIDVPVKEPFAPNPITFNTVEESKRYIQQNKVELDKLTTIKLNQLIKLPGYRVCRIDNEIGLKKDYYKGSKQNEVPVEGNVYEQQLFDKIDQSLKDQNQRIELMQDDISAINKQMVLLTNNLKSLADRLLV